MYNINTPAVELIKELLDISKILSEVGIKYETQKPVLDLAEKVYAREVLPKIKK